MGAEGENSETDGAGVEMTKKPPYDTCFERDLMPQVIENLLKGARLKDLAKKYDYSYGHMFRALRKNGYSLRSLLKAFRKYADENSIQMRLPL